MKKLKSHNYVLDFENKKVLYIDSESGTSFGDSIWLGVIDLEEFKSLLADASEVVEAFKIYFRDFKEVHLDDFKNNLTVDEVFEYLKETVSLKGSLLNELTGQVSVITDKYLHKIKNKNYFKTGYIMSLRGGKTLTTSSSLYKDNLTTVGLARFVYPVLENYGYTIRQYNPSLLKLTLVNSWVPGNVDAIYEVDGDYSFTVIHRFDLNEV